jgi:hypothetical protein
MTWIGLTNPPKTKWKRFEKGLRDLSEEDEIDEELIAEDEESSSEITQSTHIKLLTLLIKKIKKSY